MRRVSGTPKTNHNPGWKDRARAERRVAAEARQTEYNKLSPQQKLAALDKLGLRAVRERAKLKGAR